MSNSCDTTSSPIRKPSKSIAELRVDLDLKQIKDNSDSSPIIFVDKIDDDFLHLEAAISGPESTPYENAVILLNIKLSNQYPVREKYSFARKRQ